MSESSSTEFVVVGRVLSPVGLRGEIKIQTLSDVPQRFSPGGILSIGTIEYHVQHSRPMGHNLVVKLEEINSLDAANFLQGKNLCVMKGAGPSLPKDTYYYYEIQGMNVIDGKGQEIGVVTEILSTGANDVYVVNDKGKEILIPAISDVIVHVDVENSRMVVNLPLGL